MIRIDRLKSVTKSVTKCQITLALKDEVLLNKIQLMSRIDALYEFTFFPEKMVRSQRHKKGRRISRLKARPGADGQDRGYGADLTMG
jgi:hypothetical protein